MLVIFYSLKVPVGKSSGTSFGGYAEMCIAEWKRYFGMYIWLFRFTSCYDGTFQVGIIFWIIISELLIEDLKLKWSASKWRTAMAMLLYKRAAKLEPNIHWQENLIYIYCK